MAQLTRQQIDAYQRDGYLCPVAVFSPVEAARHRAALEGQEAEYRDGGLPRPVNQYHRINAHLVSEVARTVALDRRIIGAVQSLLGPDLMLWSC
jgi:hypothetical protein